MVAVVGFVLLWLGLVVVLKGEDAGAGGRAGLCDGRYTDVRECSNGVSFLYIASLKGHASCVEALIRGKADVLQCDK
jgi:hypothetical protein